MNATLDALLHSPQLPRYVEQLQQVLERERVAREHFYQTVQEGEKAEFINGEIVVHSPVKLMHNQASSRLVVLLRVYVGRRNLGVVGHEKMMISLTRNDYEPDVCFWRANVAQQFAPDQMRFPAPDFVAEVLSPSTTATDRGVKFEDYAAHSVAEYWLIDPDAETVEQYELRDQRYHLRIKATSGPIESIAVRGFEIPIRALFDEAAHGRALQGIVATP